MLCRLSGPLLGLSFVAWAGTAHAIPVDLELSLVIDSSGSINASEFDQQIDGYAAAFRQVSVINSIVNAPNGVAINTILFATEADEVITFQHLRSEEDVLDFAEALQALERVTGATNIASGIDLAAETINANEFEAGNIIIDVSGDGEQNEPGDVAASRDAALSAGVSRINGVAIRDDDVVDFYAANVIGGTDAFLLEAESFDDFDTAIARKIQIEVDSSNGEREVLRAPAQVAAPGAMGLVGIGLVMLGWISRRRRAV